MWNSYSKFPKFIIHIKRYSLVAQPLVGYSMYCYILIRGGSVSQHPSLDSFNVRGSTTDERDTNQWEDIQGSEPYLAHNQISTILSSVEHETTYSILRWIPATCRNGYANCLRKPRATR